MSRLPMLSGAQVVKALEKAGLAHVRTKGSHAILRKSHDWSWRHRPAA